MRIPLGLKNAHVTFQRYICQLLTGLLDQVCLAYLYDILVIGNMFAEHKLNLQQVSSRLKSKGMTLRKDKCVFAKPEVRYVGRLVSEQGYRPNPVDVIGPVYKAKVVGQRPSKVVVLSWSRKSKLLLQQWNKLSVRDGGSTL